MDLSRLKSYEGRLGHVFLDQQRGDLFVTMPNASFIPSDILHGTRDVHLHRHMHFGKDDPFVYPQYISQRYAHYYCIPRRDQAPPGFEALWYCLAADTDFETTKGDYGRIRTEVINNLSSSCVIVRRQTRDSVAKPKNSEARRDGVIPRLQHLMRYYCA